VVIPIYREEAAVRPLTLRIAEVFSRIGCRWEIVFALDPSPDRTREAIVELIDEGRPIRLLVFSRRIGKPLSLLAGLDHAFGDACVVMDADLQDPPELIGAMIEEWRNGAQVVIAQRRSRKGENLLYLSAAGLFYRLANMVSEVPIPRNTGDFRLLDAVVVKHIRLFRERHAFLRGINALAGFKTVCVPFDRDARYAGKKNISLAGAVNIALDGIVPFSRVPVRLVFLAGVCCVALAGIFGIAEIINAARAGCAQGWRIVLTPPLMIGCTGLLLTGMGILGEYIVRAYEETRSRPLYIIAETVERKRA
jgi:dolichol-phosphate mannosyltransferase